MIEVSAGNKNWQTSLYLVCMQVKPNTVSFNKSGILG